MGMNLVEFAPRKEIMHHHIASNISTNHLLIKVRWAMIMEFYKYKNIIVTQRLPCFDPTEGI